jgi:predicted transposase YdaD
MEWRMMDYMTRLAYTYHLEVWSVVIYVGRGAGAEDTGRHQLNGPDGMPALLWHYRVIRLWQMDAEELLALGHPALLALVGQTRIVTPATILPDVVTRIQQLPDAELRRRALAAFVALLPDEEMVAMVERLIDHEDLLLDTPFLRRLREEARAEGQAQGLEEGMLVARRRSILDVLVVRFDPPGSVYRQLEQHLETITEESRLVDLLTMAIRAHSMAAFQAALEQTHPPVTRV